LDSSLHGFGGWACGVAAVTIGFRMLVLLLFVLETVVDGHCHAWGAEATLRAVKCREAFLDGVETVSLVAQAFRGGDSAAIDRAEHHQAGID